MGMSYHVIPVSAKVMDLLAKLGCVKEISATEAAKLLADPPPQQKSRGAAAHLSCEPNYAKGYESIFGKTPKPHMLN
jgi:hypothetical protein